MTAEIAWEKYKSLNNSDEGNVGTSFDISSYEYSITLLCQALRVDDAKARVSEMKRAFGIVGNKNEFASCDDQSLTEGLAMAHCALARAYTILKKKEDVIAASQTSLICAKASKDALKRDTSFSSK